MRRVCADGFEVFEHNSFEQLLINYANGSSAIDLRARFVTSLCLTTGSLVPGGAEALQKHFNRCVFENEQEQYAREAIDWSFVTHNDNTPTLALIEGKVGGGAGLFVALDDTRHSLGGVDADQQWAAQMHKSVGSHERFITPRISSDTHFGVRHYAGDVLYHVEGFNEKNREHLGADLRELVSTSGSKEVRKILLSISKPSATTTGGARGAGGRSAGGAQGGRGKRGRAQRQSSTLLEDSVSRQFKGSLHTLLDVIATTSPAFVRCIKPNPAQAPNEFYANEIMRQLRYSGMMETVRIRQEGFAMRLPHASFLRSYRALEPNVANAAALIQVLTERLSLASDSWQLGELRAWQGGGNNRIGARRPTRGKAACRCVERG